MDTDPGNMDETLIEFADNRVLIELCGQFDRNLTQLEKGFDVVIMRRGNQIAIHGVREARAEAKSALEAIYDRLEAGRSLEQGDLDALIRMGAFPADVTPSEPALQLDMFPGGRLEIRTRKKTIEPRTATQRRYAMELFQKELVFGIGPAGTGKTYLAVAAAVSMFLEGKVERIILSRPAVEAGERLGFLPGDMKDKIDPYLRPLYDALGDMLPGKNLAKLMEEGKIEVAPLAFMRGRTLSNSFIVLDEAQNTTAMQMKMFLTRMGEGSCMAITGDPTQIDLPRGTTSGLVEALQILKQVKEIGFVHFSAEDVVRHPMVARVIRAYDKAYGVGGARSRE
ncbi:PhoH family protein [Rhodobacteraceae bacterium NNCM2]|nr:PhoH family protein [Coraliihabitans acroporae]